MADSYQSIDPESLLDYQYDWTDWIASGDSISARLWSVTPLNGTSPETPALTNATTAAVKISGCQLGSVYRLVEHITTANGLEADRTVTLRCEHR